MEINKLMDEKYPPLTNRIQSIFIDTILLILLMLVFANLLEATGEVPDWVRGALFAGLFVAYERLCTALGFTLENYVKGIRVRSHSDTSKRINVVQALLRYSVKIILGWVSFLTINRNPKRRAIDDLLSGLVMIKL